MKLFVNDKYVHIIRTEDFSGAGPYDLEMDPSIPLTEVKMQGRVLIWQGNAGYMDDLLHLMEAKKLKKLDHIDFVTDSYDEIKAFIKTQFKIVKAAGGLVFKDDLMLMIYRLGKWDLPKGKLEKGEKSLEGALREVEEECAVTASAQEKITSTWHTYVQDGRQILKKTSWFRMQCLSDLHMRPQVEENIEDIRWMTRDEVEIALTNSYQSIKEVFATLGVKAL